MPYFKTSEINILFIHIPKTGGTSVEHYFSKKYNIPLNKKSLYMYFSNEEKIKYDLKITSSLQHITYNQIFEYRKIFDINFDNIKIITIVRNPYERIISDLFYFSKLGLISMTVTSSKDEVFNMIKTYISATNLDNHNLPQHVFITIFNEKIIPNIHILHTESLTDDMHKLGYKDFNLHLHTNPEKINYIDYLNSDSIKLINDYYDKDFKLFNYKKID